MMKKIFKESQIEIIDLEDDVIATSTIEEPLDKGLPEIEQ